MTPVNLFVFQLKSGMTPVSLFVFQVEPGIAYSYVFVIAIFAKRGSILPLRLPQVD